jgi:hypothetical protein
MKKLNNPGQLLFLQNAEFSDLHQIHPLVTKAVESEGFVLDLDKSHDS